MKKALYETEVNLPATKGFYQFFCNSTLSLFTIAIGILERTKQTFEDFLKLVSCLWIVNHTNNKLEGICSISSSVCDNIFCAARQKIKDCICSHCYAYSQQSYQTGLKEHNIVNGIILRNILIPIKAFKTLKIFFPYLRIESFGDVQNVVQARNYIRIIKAFPEKRCAVWSKNLIVWDKAFQAEGKPKNTTYVHSSAKINMIDNIDLNRFNFVDHIFTVFDKEHIKRNNITINCGGKKCMECIAAKKNCYYKLSKKNDTLFINEALK